jgi:hypothetical protein
MTVLVTRKRMWTVAIQPASSPVTGFYAMSVRGSNSLSCFRLFHCKLLGGPIHVEIMVEDVTENSKGVYERYKIITKSVSRLLQAYVAHCLQKHMRKSSKRKGLIRCKTALDNRSPNKVRAFEYLTKFTNHTGLWEEKGENNTLHLSLQVEQVTWNVLQQYTGLHSLFKIITKYRLK